jgi:polyisoprenyl-teichoic acid--peptidoglycan teichoic acid transferase
MTYPAAAVSRPRRRAWPARFVIAALVALVTAASLVVAGAVYTKRTLAQATKVDLGQTLDSLGGGSAGPTSVENYLLVGSDSREGADPNDADYGAIGSASQTSGERSDTIMVLRYDPHDKSAALLSIPRDLYVTIAGTSKRDKINAAFGHGPDVLVKTVQQALAIPIHHYVEVKFAGFKNMVDAIGGVSVAFDTPLYDPNTGFRVKQPGCVHLNGVQARQYVRSRHLQIEVKGKWTEDGTADIGRMGRQQSFMRIAMDQAVSVAAGDPVAAGNMLNAALKNLTFDKGIDLPGLLNQLRKLGSSDLATYTVPAAGRTIGDQSVLIMDTAQSGPILDYFRGAATKPAGPGAARPLAAPATTKAPKTTTTAVPTTAAPTTTLPAGVARTC